MISPFVTVEEAWLLGKMAREMDAESIIGLGPVPRMGEDETFPNGFTIRAEKCPNRRGVEKVVGHFRGAVTFEDFCQHISAQRPDALWIAGGYPGDWLDEETAALLADTSLLIVQDLFASTLWDAASYQLPAAAFVERAGSFVNYNDQLQSFDWAIRPPAGVMTEGQWLWRMLGRSGLYRPHEVLREVAGEVGYFAAAVGGDIPAEGLDLKVNLLAKV